MRTDKEGFLYPEVNLSECIDCKLCEKVCPVLHPIASTEEPMVFAGINNDTQIRLQSSSGGIFTLIAESVLQKGGVVFGACFDENWKVVHGYTETVEGLARFRGSKYVQSYIGDSFLQAKKFLDEGREVLFSGTPCQIAGLKNFLRKSYRNLLTVDVVCHGVPSPKVWQKYLEESVCKAYHIKGRKNSFSFAEKICNINFRSKEKGWKEYNVSIGYNNGKKDVNPFYENSYMNVFLSNFSLRPSCYICPAKIPYVQSDITLADFWGIDKLSPEIDDDKGCGLILVNNLDFNMHRLNCRLYRQNIDEVVKYNRAIINSFGLPIGRETFYVILNLIGFRFAYYFTLCNNALYRWIKIVLKKL